MVLAAEVGPWLGGGGAAVVALGIFRLFFGDRTVDSTLQAEIAGLRKSLADQSTRHQEEIGALRERQAVLEERYDEQRTLKHAVSGDLAKAVMALEVVRRLSRNCTCKALVSVEEIVDQLLNELSTIRAAQQHRRASD